MDLVFRGGGSENAGIHPAAQKSLGKEPGDSALGRDEPEGMAALAAMVDLAPPGATWGHAGRPHSSDLLLSLSGGK